MNTVKLTYRIAITAYLIQFVLLAISTLDRDDMPLDDASRIFTGLIIVAFKALPWLVLIPGLLLRSPKIMAWMCYVCLAYFLLWVLAAFGVDQTHIAAWGIVITVVQFIAAAINTRLSKKP